MVPVVVDRKMQKPGGKVLVIGRRRPRPSPSINSSTSNVTSFSNLISSPWLKEHISSVIKSTGISGDVSLERLRKNSPVVYDSLFGPNRVRNSSPNALNPTNRHLSPLNRNFSPIKGLAQDLGDLGKENLSNITLDQESTRIDFTPVRPRSPSPLRRKVLQHVGRLEKVSSLGSESEDYTPTFDPTPAGIKAARIQRKAGNSALSLATNLEKGWSEENVLKPRNSDNDLGFGMPPPKRKPIISDKTAPDNTSTIRPKKRYEKKSSPSKSTRRSKSLDKPQSRSPIQPRSSSNVPAKSPAKPQRDPVQTGSPNQPETDSPAIENSRCPNKPRRKNKPVNSESIDSSNNKPRQDISQTSAFTGIPEKETVQPEDLILSSAISREVFPSKGFKVPQLPQIQSRKKQTNQINAIHQINQINGINPINQPEQNKTISAQPQGSVPSLPKLPRGEARYLVNWIPRLKHRKLVVEGNLMDFSKPVPDKYDQDQRWISSRITGRVSAQVVSTRSTEYVLEGELVPILPEPSTPPPPIFILHKFRFGFPEDWESLVEHWIRFEEERKMHEQSTSMLWNSTLAGNSSFLPVSGALANISAITLPGNMSHFLNPSHFKPAANSSLMPLVPETSKNISQNEVIQAEESSRTERRARSRSVRVNQNSSTQKERTDIEMAKVGPEPVPNPLERTMSILDFTQLRAKNYTSLSVVNKKKNYNCEFCDFMTPLFNMLKIHLKKTHLENTKNNVPVLTETKKRGNSEDSLLRVASKSNERVRAASDTPVKGKRKSTNSILKTSLLASQAPRQPDQSPRKASRGRPKNKITPIGRNTEKTLNPSITRKTKSSERTLNTSARKNSQEGKDKTSKTRQTSKTKSSERTLNTSVRKNSQEGKNKTSKTRQTSKTKSSERTLNTSARKNSQEGKDKTSKDRRMSTGRNMSNGRSKCKDKSLLNTEVFSPDQNRGSSVKRKSLTKERNTSQGRSKDRNNDRKNTESHKRKSLEAPVPVKKTKLKSPKSTIREPVHGLDEKYFQVVDKHVICLVCPGANKSTHKQGVKHMNTEKHKKNIQISNKEPEPEKPNPKKKPDNNISQFGRLRKNNSFLNRSSWIDMSNETPSFQTPVPVKKKKPKTKNKTTDVNKTSQEEANIEEPEKVVRRLKNPFKTSSSKETLKSAKSSASVAVSELSVNPRTVKERMKNHEIISQINKDHQDDLFQGAPDLCNLMNEDASDGSEISVVSARTPLEKYQSNRIPKDGENTTPNLLVESSPESPVKNTFSTQAFIHKKIAENKKSMARELKRKKFVSTLSTEIVTQAAKQRKIDASCRIIETLTQMSDNNEDSDAEEWFSDDASCGISHLSAQGSFLNSILSQPGLVRSSSILQKNQKQ